MDSLDVVQYSPSHLIENSVQDVQNILRKSRLSPPKMSLGGLMICHLFVYSSVASVFSSDITNALMMRPVACSQL